MQTNRRAYQVLASILAFFLILIIGKYLFPSTFGIIIDFIWFTLTSIVIVFTALGILVIFGQRKEVNKLLDMLMEGTITLVDFFNFLKELFEKIIQQVKDFLLFIAPGISYLIGFGIYLVIIYIYKFIGKQYDVTIFTILITVILMTIVGLTTLSSSKLAVIENWLQEFIYKIKHHLIDAFEVAIFVFFLTMERTDLPFLSKDLNIHLKAKMGEYDFMKRGVSTDMIQTTLTIVVAAISLEIFRYLLRLTAGAFAIYRQKKNSSSATKSSLVKDSIRDSFNSAKDDTVKFIAFTTVVLFVFLLFPRLKLLAMLTASVTALALDLVFTKRLFTTRGNDLISKVLNQILRI